MSQMSLHICVDTKVKLKIYIIDLNIIQSSYVSQPQGKPCIHMHEIRVMLGNFFYFIVKKVT